MSLARNPVEISACILVKRSSLGEATLSVECGDIFHFLLFKFFSSREVAPLFLAVMGGGGGIVGTLLSCKESIR